MIKKHNFFIPSNTVACKKHTELCDWEQIKKKVTFTYNKGLMDDMVALLRTETYEQPESITLVDRIKIAQSGLSNNEFNQLFNSIPSLLIMCKNIESVEKATLHVYLMKLRTGLSDETIGSNLGISRINKARKSLLTDFVPMYVNCLYEREQLQSFTTALVRELFCNGDEQKAALIFDGTYIYINKSGNFSFQKFTYNDQKKRNFVKPMMVVAPNGVILYVYGLNPAIKNDASIIHDMINRHAAVFEQMNSNDVIILDRGFRDCAAALKEKGFDVYMPEFLKPGKTQLTTKEANRSRLVTKCRYIVETRNGHLKTVWPLFNKVWCSYSLPHLQEDLLIGSSLLNCFKPIEATGESATSEELAIARKMLLLKDVPNEVWQVIKTNTFNKVMKTFQLCEDVSFFPMLTLNDLEDIALGTYQIKMANSYYAEHMKEENSFVIYVLPRENINKFFHHLLSNESQPHLVLTKIKSRFTSRKKHETYILIDGKLQGSDSIKGYCCSCKNGLRTVGCCSHVMLTIWYFCYAKPNNKARPIANFLNNIFDHDSDSSME